jgi:molybdate transport system substrate-binding protein
MKIFFLLLTVCLLIMLSACAPQAQSPSSDDTVLTVLAASSLTGAFQELGSLYESQNPGTRVDFNFAGSQQLAQQLAQGAPGDAFASASQKPMDLLAAEGLVLPENERVFARNRLIVVLPADDPGSIASLQDLAKPGVKLVLAAKEVPVGQYSLEFLNNAAQDPAFGKTYQDEVLKNVVSYEQNVKAVLTKVILGEADAGIVYISDITGEAAKKSIILDIPEPLNVIAYYPVASLKNSQNSSQAEEFIQLILSPEGQAVLDRYGFLPAAD